MVNIKVFAELHWAVERPTLLFRVNDQDQMPIMETVTREHCDENAIYHLSGPILQPANILAIELVNKHAGLTTDGCDHWVCIKDISINDIHADWTILRHTVFQHTMPPEWVTDMARRGIQIQDSYSPGTELRINGICSFDFAWPFFDQRLLDIWEF